MLFSILDGFNAFDYHYIISELNRPFFACFMFSKKTLFFFMHFSLYCGFKILAFFGIMVFVLFLKPFCTSVSTL